jgi:hypothetical protein
MRALIAGTVVMVTILTTGCGAPSPINASADSLMVTSTQLGGGWSVEPQQVDATYDAVTASREVVHPGADADVIIIVYVFGSPSNAHTGLQTILAQLAVQGQTDPNSSSTVTVFGDETVSFDFYSDRNQIFLWRRANVVATVAGSDQQTGDVVAIASEQSDNIDRARP